MAIKIYKPTSPGRRHARLNINPDLSKSRPEKKLTIKIKNNAGRSHGRISVRGRGGGHQRMYRIIDFKRHGKVGIVAKVLSIEYDPNRSANIALLAYNDGEKRYILSPVDLSVGDEVVAGEDVKVKIGNALPLSAIPVGTFVHNVELNPGQGGKIARSAGDAAKVMAKEEDFVSVRLSSGEIRKFRAKCFATIGQVGNLEHSRVVLGKAGRSRYLGRRPKVRGTAMSAGDHPHGGGEGRTGPGRAPKTPWGKPARGVRTRNKNKKSSKYIVKSRRDK